MMIDVLTLVSGTLRQCLLAVRSRLTADDIAAAARGAGRVARWSCRSWRGARRPSPRTSPWAASPAPAHCWTRCAPGACGCCCRCCWPTTTWTGPRTRAPSGCCAAGRRGLLEPAGRAARPGGRDRRGRRSCCRGSRWTGAGCGWAAAAARTTGCWPGCGGPGRDPALVVLLYDGEVRRAGARGSRTTSRCTRP